MYGLVVLSTTVLQTLLVVLQN